MKNKRVLIALVILLLIVSAFGGCIALRFAMNKYYNLIEKIDRVILYNESNLKDYDFNYEWVGENVLIAHAFGGVDNNTYTNSLEAFKHNYDMGYRVFEVDFNLTEDNVTICSHGERNWREFIGKDKTEAIYDYENFKNTPFILGYTPLDYMDIVNILDEHPNIIIITDTKYSDEVRVYQEFSQIVDYAKKINPEVLDRIVPQIYNQDMLSYIRSIHSFKSMIFTLYKIDWDAEEIAKFCKKSGIGFVTLNADLVEEDSTPVELWKSMNIKVGVHTVNDITEAKKLLEKGVDMIYTDFLQPELFVKE